MAIRELIAEFFTRADTKPLERADGLMDRLKKQTPQVGAAVDGLLGKVQALGALFAGSALVGAIRNFTNEFVSQAGELRRNAGAIGVTTQAYQELSLAFGGTDTLRKALERLELATSAGATGAGAAGTAFHALGVRSKDAAGQVRPLGEILPDVMDGFQRITNPVQRAALAHQLFGRASGELLPFLVRGRAGLAAARAELALLGGGVSDRAIAASRAYGAEQRRLKISLDSLKSTLAEGLLPAMASGIHSTVAFVGGFRRLLDRSNGLKHGLELLKVVLAGVAAEIAVANIPLFAAVAGFAALALAYDDFRTMMEGGNSVIGRAIDTMFGRGQSTALVQRLHDLWADTMYLVRQALEFIRGPSGTGTGPTARQSNVQGVRDVGRVLGGVVAPRRADEHGVVGTARSIGSRAWGFMRGIAGLTHETQELSDADMYALGHHGARMPVRVPGGAGGGAAATAVHLAPTTVNVTVPPGTDATTAARAGRAVAEAMDAHTDQQVRALQGALIQRTTGGTP